MQELKSAMQLKLGEHLPKSILTFGHYLLPNDDDGGDTEGNEVKKLSLASLVER